MIRLAAPAASAYKRSRVSSLIDCEFSKPLVDGAIAYVSFLSKAAAARQTFIGLRNVHISKA